MPKGYLPNGQGRRATDVSDKPFYPAKCRDPRGEPGSGGSGPPINQRGVNFAPTFGAASSAGRSYRVSPYDASTGQVDAGNGTTLVMGTQGGLRTVFGDDSWKWMLTGPVARSD